MALIRDRARPTWSWCRERREMRQNETPDEKEKFVFYHFIASGRMVKFRLFVVEAFYLNHWPFIIDVHPELPS